MGAIHKTAKTWPKSTKINFQKKSTVKSAYFSSYHIGCLLKKNTDFLKWKISENLQKNMFSKKKSTKNLVMCSAPKFGSQPGDQGGVSFYVEVRLLKSNRTVFFQ